MEIVSSFILRLRLSKNIPLVKAEINIFRYKFFYHSIFPYQDISFSIRYDQNTSRYAPSGDPATVGIRRRGETTGHPPGRHRRVAARRSSSGAKTAAGRAPHGEYPPNRPAERS